MSHGAGFTAFFDSSALYPLPLRDLLLRLAATDIFRARWSHDVLQDWRSDFATRHPSVAATVLQQQCDAMNEEARDALVEGHHVFLPIFSALDTRARHVIAAAIHSRSDVIVTTEDARYPEHILKHHFLDKQHPDEFIAHAIDLDPGKAVAAARELRLALHSPPRDPIAYLRMLERAGLPQTFSLLREFIRSM